MKFSPRASPLHGPMTWLHEFSLKHGKFYVTALIYLQHVTNESLLFYPINSPLGFKRKVSWENMTNASGLINQWRLLSSQMFVLPSKTTPNANCVPLVKFIYWIKGVLIQQIQNLLPGNVSEQTGSALFKFYLQDFKWQPPPPIKIGLQMMQKPIVGEFVLFFTKTSLNLLNFHTDVLVLSLCPVWRL